MIYVLEEIAIKPGKLREYVDAFSKEYVPNAQRRGMKLIGSWVTPPVELEGVGNQLVALFSIDGVDEFWKMRSHSRAPDVEAWWRKAEPMQVSRSRRFLDPAGASPLR